MINRFPFYSGWKKRFTLIALLVFAMLIGEIKVFLFKKGSWVQFRIHFPIKIVFSHTCILFLKSRRYE